MPLILDCKRSFVAQCLVATVVVTTFLSPLCAWAVDLRIVTSHSSYGTKIYSYDGSATTLINTHVKLMYGNPTSNGSDIAYVSSQNAVGYAGSNNRKLIIRNKDTGTSSADALLNFNSYVGGADTSLTASYPLSGATIYFRSLDYSIGGGLYLFLQNLVSGQYEIATVSLPSSFSSPVSVTNVMNLGIAGGSFLASEPVFHRATNQYFYVISQTDPASGQLMSTIMSANVATGSITNLGNFNAASVGLSSLTIDEGTGALLANTYGAGTFGLMYAFFPQTTFGVNSIAAVATSTLLLGNPTPFPSGTSPAPYDIPINFLRQATKTTATGLDYFVSYRSPISGVTPELKIEQHSLSVGAGGVVDSNTLHTIDLPDVVAIPIYEKVSVLAF